jgi:large subunit ribosomal protein L4
VHVVSTFVDGSTPKTKSALATLAAVTTAKKVLVVLDRDDSVNWISLRNEPRVHLLESGQLNTYDVLNADEVVFTETALAEFVGRKPDLATRRVPGGVPSVAPAQGDGAVETPTSAEAAPAKKAAAKKTVPTKAAAKKAVPADDAATAAEAPAKKAAAKKAASEAPEDVAPATPEEAAKAPAKKAAKANAGTDAVAPTDEGTTSASKNVSDASTEEKA